MLRFFFFLLGLGMGPLLEIVIAVEPAIIPTAFLATCLIFACFTLASMISNQRQYIYLGGKKFDLLYLCLKCYSKKFKAMQPSKGRSISAVAIFLLMEIQTVYNLSLILVINNCNF